MHLFATQNSAAKSWPRIVYGVALIRIAIWTTLISFCLVSFEYSVIELNRLIRHSRPHFEGLTVNQTRDFLVVYLIFGFIYVLIDGNVPFFLTFLM